MKMKQFDGNKSVFKGRRGAPRDAFASGKRLGAALGTDLTHRRPGAFDPWTSSHAFADAMHRHAARSSPRGKIVPVKWFIFILNRSRPESRRNQTSRG
jgi:hypothetical protein